MLSSITPLGERSRNQRWPITVTSIAIGGAGAGAIIGAALAAAGTALSLDDRQSTGMLGLVIAVGLAVDLLISPRPLLPRRRQVDERWLRLRGWVYGLGFGAQLGAGVATVVTTSTVYVMMVAALLAPTVRQGMAIGLVFGTVRGLAPILTVRITTTAQLARFHRRFLRLDRPTRFVTWVVQVALATCAVGVSL
jgi:MFS family permease